MPVERRRPVKGPLAFRASGKPTEPKRLIMAKYELLRLERIKVEGLFDIYNHHIELNLEERATLVHGPNGVGKTVVLRMIDALLRNRLSFFQTIPFSRFLLGFHDGSTLELKATSESESNDRRYTLTLTRDGKPKSSKVTLLSRAEAIAAQIDYLRPYENVPDTWKDIRDGEVLSASEILSRFGSADLEHSSQEDINWFSAFLENAKTHLIEVQRLVRVDRKLGSGFDQMLMSRGPSTIPAVVECSRDFRNRLSETMARYGRQSQTLDQSFPQRLILATDELDELPVDELQEQMNVLDKKTDGLKAIGILDKTPEHPLDGVHLGNIDPTQARVMTLYVRDTEKKLQALDDLASRTRLLLDNVNQKYRHKQIRLDREEGFVAEHDNGLPLPLESLSSGEQHELVLHYDLLFRVPSNTLVLIDEPELSLHVAWQKRFLPDLLEILQLSDLDALIATHSPYIIGDREDLMVGLGDPD